MFVFELYVTPIKVQSYFAFYHPFVVEEGSKWVDGYLCDFRGGFVGEVEFDFDLAAVWFLDKHIILGDDY
jgi:hypothetical protein